MVLSREALSLIYKLYFSKKVLFPIIIRHLLLVVEILSNVNIFLIFRLNMFKWFLPVFIYMPTF